MSRIVETYNKGSSIEVEADDLIAVTQLAEASLRRTHGRLAKYEDSADGLERFMEKATAFFQYVNEVNSNPDLEKKLIPDVENLCIYLGITRKTLSMYHRRNEMWADAIDLVKDGIMACKKQLVMTHRMPPLIFIFDSVNNFAYHNVAEFHLKQDNPIDTSEIPRISSEQIRQIAERGLPEMPKE